MSKFYKILLSTVAAGLVLLAAATVFLLFVLADYESTVPGTVAQNAFDKYVQTLRFSELFGQANEFETAEDINKVAKDRYSGKTLELVTGASFTDSEYSFFVKAGEEKVLGFTVVKSGEQSRFGFEKYKIGTVDLGFDKDITVRAPSYVSVKINGKQLSELYRTEGDEKEAVKLPAGIEPISYFTYKVTGLLSDPEVTATDEAGNACEVVFDDSSEEYSVSHAFSEQLKNDYSDYVIAATKNYATYMQDDGYFGMITKYFEAGTETYNYIKDTSVSFVWDHDRYSFENEWAGEFHAYSDDVFTCRVKVTQVLYLGNREPYKDHIDLILCLRKVDGKYMIYSLTNNE